MIIKRVAPFFCAKVVSAIYAIFLFLGVCLSTIVSLISPVTRIATGWNTLAGVLGGVEVEVE